ncbi:hypothetical protein EVAR_29536_1 [Eumeta japonica]|uniref:Uncharacterized protein n=1 Tax=Eumeta variegata TaxID=151549 RepID=A0A4C1WFQ8_EUMVA|nr:hypothetical protein EVAR_29536_1 [Eumeta japonica]
MRPAVRVNGRRAPNERFTSVRGIAMRVRPPARLGTRCRRAIAHATRFPSRVLGDEPLIEIPTNILYETKLTSGMKAAAEAVTSGPRARSVAHASSRNLNIKL